MNILRTIAIAMIVLMLAGCNVTQSKTLQATDGTVQTQAVSMSVLSDRASANTHSAGNVTTTTGGRHKPDPTVTAMAPVIRAGIVMLVLGVVLTLVRLKFPIVPLGASLGLAGLGLGMILLGGMMPALAGNMWLIVIVGGIGLIMYGPALWANFHDRIKGRRDE
jgi:small-conductance mechanosensitive channel